MRLAASFEAIAGLANGVGKPLSGTEPNVRMMAMSQPAEKTLS
jgi:hypothetical protein